MGSTSNGSARKSTSAPLRLSTVLSRSRTRRHRCTRPGRDRWSGHVDRGVDGDRERVSDDLDVECAECQVGESHPGDCLAERPFLGHLESDLDRHGGHFLTATVAGVIRRHPAALLLYR